MFRSNRADYLLWAGVAGGPPIPTPQATGPAPAGCVVRSHCRRPGG
jgi:hypothetical protein